MHGETIIYLKNINIHILFVALIYQSMSNYYFQFYLLYYFLTMIQEQSRVEPYRRPQQRPAPQIQQQNMHQRPIEDYENIPHNTLDYGICKTLCAQFSEMIHKFSYVLIPRPSRGSTKLKNWDLWGPFFMCLIFGFFINNSTQFLILAGAVFGGATIVTFNTRILGGKISYFQSVSILGYCIFPLFLIIFGLKIISIFGLDSMVIRIIGIIIASIWGVFSSQVFIAFNISPQKKFVSLYPICLFYLFIGLMVIYM